MDNEVNKRFTVLFVTVAVILVLAAAIVGGIIARNHIVSLLLDKQPVIYSEYIKKSDNLFF